MAGVGVRDQEASGAASFFHAFPRECRDTRSMSRWIAVRIEAAPEMHAAISEVLFGMGAGGVQDERGVLITHFPPGCDENAIRAAVRAVAENARIEMGDSPDVDWSEAWKSGLHRHELGALTVTPPWLADGLPRGATVVIEPGTGFGTGEHPTTRSVIRLMQRVLRKGDVVADLGSGSGILSIAAAKLGASRVIAIEMDEDSNQNAADNIALNDVGDVVTLLPGDAALLLPLVAPVDVIFANIISSVLLPMMPVMRAALRATATDSKPAVILAGILGSERAMMLDGLSGWHVVQEDVEGDWWSVLLAPA